MTVVIIITIDCNRSGSVKVEVIETDFFISVRSGRYVEHVPFIKILTVIFWYFIYWLNKSISI